MAGKIATKLLDTPHLFVTTVPYLPNTLSPYISLPNFNTLLLYSSTYRNFCFNFTLKNCVCIYIYIYNQISLHPLAVGGREMTEKSRPLEYTPTWVVAAICSIIVFISFCAERGLHRLGKVRIQLDLYSIMFFISGVTRKLGPVASFNKCIINLYSVMLF